jgi:cellobiose-specific phosphotransferase system component IIC
MSSFRILFPSGFLGSNLNLIPAILRLGIIYLQLEIFLPFLEMQKLHSPELNAKHYL